MEAYHVEDLAPAMLTNPIIKAGDILSLPTCFRRRPHPIIDILTILNISWPEVRTHQSDIAIGPG